MENRQKTEMDLQKNIEDYGLMQLQTSVSALKQTYEEMLSVSSLTDEQQSKLQEKAEELQAHMAEAQAFINEQHISLQREKAARKTAEDAKIALMRQYTGMETANRYCLAELESAQKELTTLQSELSTLYSSTSWKVTAPLRVITRGGRRVIGKSARATFRGLKKLFRPEKAPKTVALLKDWPPVVKNRNRKQKPQPVSVNAKRVAIYTFFDKDGVVDEYVLYFLKILSTWTSRIVVVCNGNLQSKGELAFKQLGCEVLYRENKGFDAWGVKAGLDHIGFEELGMYDELLVANNTLFGPICDLTPMFETMSARSVDFWGIASHAGMKDFDPFQCNPYGYIPEHIQSFFYGVRGNLIRSDEFREFWTRLPELSDYNAAVGLYETVMTQYFTDAGFVWSCYMNGDEYYDMTDNPLIAMPVEAIRDWKSPFFKRRAFFQDYDYLTSFTGQQSASYLLQYLQEETDYPLDLIWENLIRTCHMSDLVRNLHLSWIFDRENQFYVSETSVLKAALFMHIYDHTMAEELASYAASMPESADIYISTVSEEKKEAILMAFGHLKNHVEVRVLPNRGRDVSALLASFKDVVMEYDVACVTHDKKTGYLKPQTVGEGFAYMGYENILGSEIFVQQVLQAFQEDERLGLLYAPDPNHADFITHIGLEWGANFACTKDLAQELKLHIPLDEKHPPMAPFGSSFWFRTKAMVPLFAKDWTYEDFPEEPFNMTDGSILHAIERIYPYVAQDAGYYSAMLATADYASIDIGNLYYYAQTYAHVCADNGICNHFITVRDLSGMRLDAAGSKMDGATAQRGREVNGSVFRRLMRKIRATLLRWANE